MSDLGTTPTVSVVDCGGEDEARLARLVEAVPTTEIHMGVPSADELLARARCAQVVVTLYTYTSLDAALLAQLPELELIATRTAGYSHIDAAQAARQGVRVATVPSATAPSVAEYVFGALIASQRRLFEAHESTRTGAWDYAAFRGFELMGSTLGVIGLGTIGRRVARLGTGFGMNTLGWTRSGRSVEGVESVSLDELLTRSRVVVVCLALNEETRGIIGPLELARMRPDAWLVNAARGGLIDEAALSERLRDGLLGGAVLDVLDEEPPDPARLVGLAETPNLLVTPHIAWHTGASLERQFGETIENVLAFLRGEERNLIPL